MADFESVITRRGQVTIPVDLRRKLGLQPHDRVQFELTNGSVTITPVRSRLEEFYGSVTPRTRPEDFEVLRNEFETGVANDIVR